MRQLINSVDYRSRHSGYRPLGVNMEQSQTTSRLRASTLWVPGILAVLLGVSIHAHVGSLRQRARVLAENSTVCWLPVESVESTAQHAPILPLSDGDFIVRFVLSTPLPADRNAASPTDDGDGFPDNEIARVLGTAVLTVPWKIRSEGQPDLEGVISKKNLCARTQAGDIRYIFGSQTVSLTADRRYELVAEGADLSPEISGFTPALILEAPSPLRKHPLAGWRLRDTGLLVLLGVSLISLGVSKRYSDRKRRRSVVLPLASDME